MLFSVIYSADCPRTESIARFRPPRVRRLWDQTENDSQYEYSYLEGDWDRGKHRKWFAMLDKDQFTEFVQATGLVADSTQTLGSLESPVSASAGARHRLQRRRQRPSYPQRLRDADPRNP